MYTRQFVATIDLYFLDVGPTDSTGLACWVSSPSPSILLSPSSFSSPPTLLSPPPPLRPSSSLLFPHYASFILYDDMLDPPSKCSVMNHSAAQG